ncbi:MAG: CorA family divalent cation transporter, partial [Gammaproteobacteria bacterium]
MSDLIKDYRPLNRPPGTLTAVPGEDSTARIHLLEYRGEQINVVEISGLEQLAQQLADGHPASAVTWVHVVGLGDMRTMQGLAEMFKLHPLAMEDVTHLGQRSKVEAYDNQLQFVVLQHLAFTQDEVKVTQVALFVGKDFVVSFQPGGTDLFEPLRSRICETQGRIHERGADYLAYIIIDLVIDTAFPVLEALGEQLDTLEDNVVNRPAPNVINTIYQLQRQLLNLRRVLWPQREVLSRLMRDDLGFISTEM